MDKIFSLKRGDNGLLVINENGKYFLAMKYEDEASLVVNKLNLIEIQKRNLELELSELKEENKNLHFKIWKLRNQLKDNNIEEDSY